MTAQELLPLFAITSGAAESPLRITTSLSRIHPLGLIVEGSLSQVEAKLLVDLIEPATAGRQPSADIEEAPEIHRVPSGLGAITLATASENRSQYAASSASWSRPALVRL